MTLDVAEDKGRKARLKGIGRASCPYSDRRFIPEWLSPRLHKSFIQAWLKGWDDTDRFMKDMNDRDQADAGNSDLGGVASGRGASPPSNEPSDSSSPSGGDPGGRQSWPRRRARSPPSLK